MHLHLSRSWIWPIHNAVQVYRSRSLQHLSPTAAQLAARYQLGPVTTLSTKWAIKVCDITNQLWSSSRWCSRCWSCNSNCLQCLQNRWYWWVVNFVKSIFRLELWLWLHRLLLMAVLRGGWTLRVQSLELGNFRRLRQCFVWQSSRHCWRPYDCLWEVFQSLQSLRWHRVVENTSHFKLYSSWLSGAIQGYGYRFQAKGTYG